MGHYTKERKPYENKALIAYEKALFSSGLTRAYTEKGEEQNCIVCGKLIGQHTAIYVSASDLVYCDKCGYELIMKNSDYKKCS